MYVYLVEICFFVFFLGKKVFDFFCSGEFGLNMLLKLLYGVKILSLYLI